KLDIDGFTGIHHLVVDQDAATGSTIHRNHNSDRHDVAVDAERVVSYVRGKGWRHWSTSPNCHQDFQITQLWRVCGVFGCGARCRLTSNEESHQADCSNKDSTQKFRLHFVRPPTDAKSRIWRSVGIPQMGEVRKFSMSNPALSRFCIQVFHQVKQVAILFLVSDLQKDCLAISHEFARGKRMRRAHDPCGSLRSDSDLSE